MPRINKLATALALAFAGIGAAQAQQFSGVVSFGDSLSDAGNIAALSGLPPGNSFTTNPDPVAAQIVAAAFGYNQGNSLAGGSNYAYGGACANAAGPCVNPAAPRLGQQLAQYLTPRGGRADGNALYTVWMGANDIFAALGGGVWTTQPQIQAGTTVVATSVVGNVLALQNAGANYIVIFNLPDLGRTPQFLGAGATAAGAASFAAVSYNTALNQGLLSTRDGIIPVNTFALVNEVIADPGKFGFANVVGTACTGPGAPSSVACGPVGSGLPYTYAAGANNSFFFADGVHPTGAAHAILAKVILATIAAPGHVSLAGEVPLQVYEDHSGAINYQLFSSRVAGREIGEGGGYARLQFGDQTYDGSDYSPELDSNLATLTAGADFRHSETFSFGGALSLGRSNGDADTGSLNGTEFLGSVYGVAQFGQGYINAIASGGSNSLEINRTLQLGPNFRTEEGKTDATHLAFELGGGFDFGSGDLHHGVFGNVVWQNVSVDGYAEETNTATTMRFSEFERDSLTWRIGYQIEGKSGRWSPYARIAYAAETEDDISHVQAGSTSMNGTFTLAGYEPSGDWIEADIGVTMELNETSQLFFGYQGHLNDDAQSRNSLNAGVRMTF